MPSRYSSYDDYDYDNSYASPQSSRRPSRITKVIEVPDDRLAFIRQRELAAFYGEPEKSLVLRREESPENISNDNVASSRQLVRRQRQSMDDTDSRGSDGYYRRSSRRDGDRGYPPDSRRNGRRSARAQSEGGWNRQSQQQDQQQQRSQTNQQDQSQSQSGSQSRGQNGSQSQGQGQNKGQGNGQTQAQADEQKRRMIIRCNKDTFEKGELNKSLRERKDGNFVQRNFDSSWDGLIAAGAGAALGAITVRQTLPFDTSEAKREEHKKKNRLKMLGAAVVGAAALNSAENWFRVWAEEHEEGSEWVNTCGEMCAEGFENFPIA